MDNISALKNSQIIEIMSGDSTLNKVRKLFSQHAARIEQTCAQTDSPDVFELRRMEFRAAIAIAEVLGIELSAEEITTPSP